ncbi:MAG: hypothetical protein HYY00_08295 [Chloroflexi bacterium]|nr:hypothetical protein [Chloroflexota bacterium]
MDGSFTGGSNLVLWAKLEKQPNPPPDYHPLICHLLDVACVTRALWNTALSPAGKARLSSALGLSTQEDAAGQWIAFIAGLPALDVLAEEIAEDLRAALEQFEEIGTDLKGS